MCNYSEYVIEKALKRDKERGERRGVIKSLRALMKNTSSSFEQASDMLGIPASEREQYRKLLNNQ